MGEIIRDYIFSNTSKDSSVLFGGTIVSTLLNFVIVILLTRDLSTSDFGIFITALAFTQLVTDMLEMGINPATLNFLSIKPGDESVIKTGFVLKVGVALVSSVLVFFLAGLISSVVFKNDVIEPFVKISSVGIFLSMLIVWGQSVFQAKRNFPMASIINASPNIVRFITVLILVVLGMGGVLNLFWFYQLVLVVSLILVLNRLGLKFVFKKINESEYKNFFKFGLPVGLSFMVAALYTRLDQIFIFNISGSQEAGLYGLASRLTTIFVFLISSVNTAVVPRFASIDRSSFEVYFGKVKKISYLISGLGLLAILLSPLIPLIFGVKKYEGSILPFQILMVGIIFFALSFPYSSAILYRLKKTAFSFWLSVFSLVIIWILLTVLIKQYKSVGAALAVSIIYLLQFVISFFYFNFLLNEAPD